MNDQERAEHHEQLAGYVRQSAETYRNYLTWSADADERRWARAMADAAEVEADAQARFAAALRARAEVPA
jgi:ADP-heptose:LPS heptosyltransferase